MRAAFDRLSDLVTHVMGSPWALFVAVGVIVIWLITGPLFGFSDTWQLIINTGTTIVTFLMVFVIQSSQNRHAKAVHLKLDELIAAIEKADNSLMGAEMESEDEQDRQIAALRRLADRTTEQADHLESERGSNRNRPHARGEKSQRAEEPSRGEQDARASA
jgi:low affinity Fe/Cu permease